MPEGGPESGDDKGNAAAVPGDWQSSCPDQRSCKGYHPYIRPPTNEIIKRLYPIRKGRTTKVFPSGATMDGSMSEDDFGEADFNGTVPEVLLG